MHTHTHSEHTHIHAHKLQQFASLAKKVYYLTI